MEPCPSERRVRREIKSQRVAPFPAFLGRLIVVFLKRDDVVEELKHILKLLQLPKFFLAEVLELLLVLLRKRIIELDECVLPGRVSRWPALMRYRMSSDCAGKTISA